MEFVHDIVRNLNNINQVHNSAFSFLDKCFFNIKNKKDDEDKYYEFMLLKNIFIAKEYEYELHIYNKPTETWIELYSTDSKEEMIKYISEI